MWACDVCVYPFQVVNQLSDFQETLYESFAFGGTETRSFWFPAVINSNVEREKLRGPT